MGKNHNPSEIEHEISEHSAVKAWSLLNPHLPKPQKIEVIREKRLSVYGDIIRLVGVGRNGVSVIAKNYNDISKVKIENSIYQDALNYISKTTLHYYGYIELEKNTFWVFIEDASGSPFLGNNAQHRSLAIDWLSELHTSIPKLDFLPDRGIDYYHSRLVSGRDKIIKNMFNKYLCDTDIILLKSIISQLDFLMHRWNKIYTLYEQMPKGMIHGDFKFGNMQVRNDADESILLVFDWEEAGWGLPGIDMFNFNPEKYWLRVRNHWNNTNLDTIIKLANLGKMLHFCIAIDWEAWNLAYEWLVPTIEKMKKYKMCMTDAIANIDIVH